MFDHPLGQCVLLHRWGRGKTFPSQESEGTLVKIENYINQNCGHELAVKIQEIITQSGGTKVPLESENSMIYMVCDFLLWAAKCFMLHNRISSCIGNQRTFRHFLNGGSNTSLHQHIHSSCWLCSPSTTLTAQTTDGYLCNIQNSSCFSLTNLPVPPPLPFPPYSCPVYQWQHWSFHHSNGAQKQHDLCSHFPLSHHALTFTSSISDCSLRFLGLSDPILRIGELKAPLKAHRLTAILTTHKSSITYRKKTWVG